MFKHELGQIIWYMKDNRVHSAPVLSRALIENLHEDFDSTEEQKKAFKVFGDGDILYSTIHGIFPEFDVYSSEEALKNDL